MSQATKVLPKIIELDYDSGTRRHYVALPSCVSRSDAEAFRQLAGPQTFEFHRNSGSWITQRGLTAVPGITTRSSVIIVSQSLYDRVKSLFYEWLENFLKDRMTTAVHKARAASA